MTARPQRRARLQRGPFSRFIDTDNVPDHGLDMAIDATPDECLAVAEEIGLPAIVSLSADFDIARRSGGRFEVKGQVRSTIRQICVVSLEPFETAIDQDVDLVFARQSEHVAEGRAREHARRGRPAIERDVAPASVPGNDDQIDPPDPLIDDTIDLGSVAVEFLTLAIEPYPRKPGVEFVDVVVGQDDATPSAFAALERLKARS